MSTTKKCPKCGYTSVADFADCPSCGVIIIKFLEREKEQKEYELKLKSRSDTKASDALQSPIESKNKTVQVIGFIVGTIILYFLFNSALMLWQLTPITKVSKYRNVKNLRWHRHDLIEHFPGKIPSGAQGARLYYRAGFLQGGASIELRIQMPEKFVEKIYATYRPQAMSIFNKTEKFARSSEGPGVPPKRVFFTFPFDGHETSGEAPHLPQDFEILPLSPPPYNLNHGETSGISISRKRREIIYWAEDW